MRCYLGCEQFFDEVIYISYKFKASTEFLFNILVKPSKIWVTGANIIDYVLFARCYSMCFT